MAPSSPIYRYRTFALHSCICSWSCTCTPIPLTYHILHSHTSHIVLHPVTVQHNYSACACTCTRELLPKCVERVHAACFAIMMLVMALSAPRQCSKQFCLEGKDCHDMHIVYAGQSCNDYGCSYYCVVALHASAVCTTSSTARYMAMVVSTSQHTSHPQRHCLLPKGLSLRMACAAYVTSLFAVFALQILALDIQALLLACTAVTTASPLQKMSRHRPPSSVATWPNFVLMSMMTFLFFCCDCTTIAYLCTRPWFAGGNGTAKEVTVHILLHLHYPRVTAIYCGKHACMRCGQSVISHTPCLLSDSAQPSGLQGVAYISLED